MSASCSASPLDTEERRNLGRYVKNLIEKQSVGVADLLRFSGHYATRTVREPKDKALAGLGRRCDGLGKGSGDSIAVVGASEDLFEGDF